MATINFANHECGDFSDYQGRSAGAISIQSTVKKSGTYALRSNPTTTGTGFAFLEAISATGVGANANVATSYLRFWFQYLVKPASNDEYLLAVYDAVTPYKISVTLSNLGALGFFTNTSGAIGPTTLQSGQWYRIDLVIPTGTSAGWFLLLNGAVELSGTSNFGTTNTFGIFFGKYADRNGNSVDFYYDDIFWSDSAGLIQLGQGAILAPNANGIYANGTAHGAASLWQCLNQVPSDGDTTYIDTLLATQIVTAKCTPIPGAAVINSVKAMIITRNLGAGGTQTVVVISGPGSTQTTAVAATSSYASYCKILDTDPNTSLPWTNAALNAAEVGMLESIAGNRLTAAFLLVDYIPFVGDDEGPIYLFRRIW